ncbi:MAG: uroporphyrinogen decarboxylase family protein [Eubacteriales bacterium]|nr:uroporphyrinogen decarboxylase family protein [Eubacteriales bacterium]
MSTQSMTVRERLSAALRSKEVDRLPWAPLTDPYFVNSIHLQGFDMNHLQIMKHMGCDFMERHVCNPKPIYRNVTMREERTPDVERTYYDTPVGSIYIERKHTSGNTWYVSKHSIETLEDVKVFTYIAQNTTYEANVEGFIAREKELGDDGIATPSGNMSPVQDVLQFAAGVENTVYLMADYPDEMDEMFDAMQQRNLRQYTELLKYPTDVIIDYEDTSSTVMSKNMFKNYSLPAIDEYADLCHTAGKLYITHMCGKLTAFVNEIGSGRQDGVDSVCPAGTGDLDPWTARETWGPGKVVIGGIDPPDLSRVTVEEAMMMAVRAMKRVANKRGFILSTGDAVPYGTPVRNMSAIADLIAYLGPKSLSGDFDESVIKQFL